MTRVSVITGGAGGGDRPWSRSPAGDGAGGGDDKPWAKRSAPGGGRDRGEERRTGDAPRKFDSKPGGRPDKPRGVFHGKSKGAFNRNDQRGPRRDGRPQHGQFDRREAAFEENGEVWIWGIHAATAALNNPLRKISTAFMTRSAAERAGLRAGDRVRTVGGVAVTDARDAELWPSACG